MPQNSEEIKMDASKRQQTLKINSRNQLHMNRKVGEAVTQKREKF